MSKGEKSIWDLALDKANANEDEKQGEEAYVLFCGSKTSGKSSIINRFLERDDAPKPTVALEYTFGRRAKGHNLAKDVGHIWELGGGTWLSKLFDVALNVDTIKNMSVVLVVDLSSPGELWFTADSLLSSLRSRIDSVITEARVNDPTIKDNLKQAAWQRVGKDHPDLKWMTNKRELEEYSAAPVMLPPNLQMDKDMMDPLLIPLVIIGGKYDIFQDFDSEKKKVICKTLRFLAHVNGAHLQFFSTKQDGLVNRARTLLSHLLFTTNASQTVQIDHNKPLMVPFGQDSLQQIGNPPLPDGDIGKVVARNPVELWKSAYTAFFPQDTISDPSLVEDPAKDTQYAEAAVDNMRKQKDEELERYRKMSERRAREVAQRGVET